jgi:hypothetical protein
MRLGYDQRLIGSGNEIRRSVKKKLSIGFRHTGGEIHAKSVKRKKIKTKSWKNLSSNG